MLMLTIIYTKYSTWSIAEWELDIIIMHKLNTEGEEENQSRFAINV